MHQEVLAARGRDDARAGSLARSGAGPRSPDPKEEISQQWALRVEAMAAIHGGLAQAVRDGRRPNVRVVAGTIVEIRALIEQVRRL